MSVDVSIDRLSVTIGGNRILDEVSLHVPAGSFVTLLGPSGSGKTTTLNVLAGFVAKSGGSVALGGQVIDDLPPHRRNIGFLFQNYALFPHMSVEQNIAFPLVARKVPAAQRRSLVAKALELVQLPNLAKRSVRSLSGGQQQRIALARALVFQPRLLLLDEPLAALDKQLREAMQLELKNIQAETGTTTIAVTHDQVEAMSMADSVAIMNEGRLVQVGSPEEVYRRPADLFVARFLGEANLIPVDGGRLRGFGAEAPGQVADPIAVVRPEDLDVVAAGTPGAAEGRIESEVFQGARRRLTVAVSGIKQPLIVATPPQDATAAGPDGRIALRLRGATVHAVSAAGSAAPVHAGGQTDWDAADNGTLIKQ